MTDVFRTNVRRTSPRVQPTRRTSSRGVVRSSASTSRAQTTTQTPSYVDRLTQLINQVSAGSLALEKQQQTLQQQALAVQQQQVNQANEERNIERARTNDASRESYVTLLQQILLNT